MDSKLKFIGFEGVDEKRDMVDFIRVDIELEKMFPSSEMDL